MSRTLSASMLRAMYEPETGDYPIFLITLNHWTLDEPIRCSSDPTQRIAATDEDVHYGTNSRGDSYVFMPFTLILPPDDAEQAAKTTISIDNVTRELVPTIRALYEPPKVTLEIVMASAPDVVEVRFPDFKLTNITYDELSIVGELTLDMLETEPFPCLSITPTQFPAAF